MENDKHPTEIIKELDYEIRKVEDTLTELLGKTTFYESKLNNLKQRKQSLINYLNHDDE